MFHSSANTTDLCAWRTSFKYAPHYILGVGGMSASDPTHLTLNASTWGGSSSSCGEQLTVLHRCLPVAFVPHLYYNHQGHRKHSFFKRWAVCSLLGHLSSSHILRTGDLLTVSIQNEIKIQTLTHKKVTSVVTTGIRSISESSATF